jgi:hypothetical protein
MVKKGLSSNITLSKDLKYMRKWTKIVTLGKIFHVEGAGNAKPSGKNIFGLVKEERQKKNHYI